jgi:RNA-directed DNA polymerase
MGLIRFLRNLLGLDQQPVVGTRPTPAPPGKVVVPSFAPPAPRAVSEPVPRSSLAAAKRAADHSLVRLRLERFAPLSRDELAKVAGSGSITRSWSLWRSDTIPPSADPTTNLIDRSLVAEGLLTADDLVRIHEVGDTYRSFRPDLLDVHAAGAAAVSDDRAARQQRREEKRAAAAKRKEAHTRAVAERKANDIIFLGRGVSTWLHDRRANIERLQQAGLPILTTPADVAKLLGLTIPRLRWLAFHNESAETCHYVHFQVPKKSGGMRRLSAPHTDLAAAQQLILERIVGRLPIHQAAHGFVPQRSILTNATPHVRALVVVNLDLKDFFPSIGFARIRGLLKHAGYSPCVATIIALLCTECPRHEVTFQGRKLWVAAGPRALPQGACTSPALANITARLLDARLAGLAQAWGWTYTRYADDLTLSSTSPTADIGALLGAVRRIVADERFTVNENKTRVLRRNQAQEVTGLIVNDRPKVPRTTMRRLRAILHRAQSQGLAAQNRDGHPNFPAWVDGMISYIAMTDPAAAARFRAQRAALPNG